jgi:hypothetical protein
VNLQIQLAIMTDFSCLHTQRVPVRSANLTEPQDENLLLEERLAANQLQRFTYSYSNLGFLFVVLTRKRFAQNTR